MSNGQLDVRVTGKQAHQLGARISRRTHHSHSGHFSSSVSAQNPLPVDAHKIEPTFLYYCPFLENLAVFNRKCNPS
jgi:hypothetical protein